jgi:hypothetical protein
VLWGSWAEPTPPLPQVFAPGQPRQSHLTGSTVSVVASSTDRTGGNLGACDTPLICYVLMRPKRAVKRYDLIIV